jgi:hypothetical protein
MNNRFIAAAYACLRRGRQTSDYVQAIAENKIEYRRQHIYSYYCLSNQAHAESFIINEIYVGSRTEYDLNHH